ncbi:PQQ-binding-like beta-propeller repeat protein [Nocardioides sp. HDW12B]|uniref:outer membrane protein assembly factor BamB family protein n=1 Tax=Nocardioides sp. HDW12B TaxID=2714939 RepID=UPI00140A374C|nr:PQQ-binding-like beta-propeller repeat protein [Nocardioides sp. HDW12B]QIK67873.1 PQQ-binding-like beta-propeller repeat protein [Nocardioides sp. HDW12B]
MGRLAADVPELVARAELVPSGTVGRQRGPVVAAFEDLARPFGPLLAGRFFKPRDPAPALLPLGEQQDDRLGLVGRTSLRVVDLPSGEVAWSVELDASIVRGGPVGDAVTLLTSGASPAVLTLDGATGELLACAEVPLAGAATGQPATTLQTDQAGPDVVVVAGRVASPVTAARLPVLPGTPEGSVSWRRALDGVTEAAGVTVAGDRLVVSRVVDPVRLAELAVAGGIEAPLVTTYDAATGDPSWTYPDRPPDDRAAMLLGEDAGTGSWFVLEAAPGRDDRVTRSEWALVALDAAGEERWRRPLGAGLVSGSVWGERIVLQGPEPGGGARLRAFDLDGRASWSVSTPDLPFGEQRDNFGPSTAVGDQRLVPSPNGLVALDPERARPRPLNVREPIDELVLVGEHLVVRSGPALLVLAVED